MTLAGLAVFGLVGVAAFSRQNEPETQPARFGSIEIERVVFVDSHGRARAQLSAQYGPFVVIDRIPTPAFPGDSSWVRQERFVPPLDELSPELIEQLAEGFGREVASAFRNQRRYRMPVLVFSDAEGKPFGIVEASEIGQHDPHAEKKLRQLAELRLGGPKVNPEPRR